VTLVRRNHAPCLVSDGSMMHQEAIDAAVFPVATQALRGQKIYMDAIVEGETMMGSNKWANVARRPPEQLDARFIKLELLRHGN
jgi:hypothetical protein